MAGERDLQAAAERGAVECRDDRLAQRLERALRGLDARDVVEELLKVLVADLDQVAQVASGEERVLRRGDDHAGQRVLLGDEPVDGRGKRAAERPVHGVGALVGIVHGQRDDAVGVLSPVDHAHTRSTIVGSCATTPVATTRARGVSPMSRPACSLPTIVSAAPSTMPDELPGVCTWLMRSTQWYFCSATASNPPMSPIAAKDGLSAASASGVVPGRGNSS